MAQAVSRRPLTGGGRIRAWVNPYASCGGQNGTGTGLLQALRFTPVIAFHRRCPHSYHLEMNNVSASGSSSETLSHPIIIKQWFKQDGGK
jgi:hypothetical protein